MSSNDGMESRETSVQARVLVVDDEVANRELISNFLTSEGYDVVTARDGVDALSQLAVPLPDLIVSDLRMPRMSGVEFLAVVRQKYPDVPVIAISGEFGGDDVPPGVPADAYLQKGAYSFLQLRTIITDLLYSLPRELRQPASGVMSA